jgi:hypothetical protein
LNHKKEFKGKPAVVSKRGVDGNQKVGALPSRPKRAKIIIPYFDIKLFLWYKIFVWEFERNEEKANSYSRKTNS